MPPGPRADLPPAGPAPRVDLGPLDDGAVADRLQVVERWVWAGLQDPGRASGWHRWSGEALAALVTLHAASEHLRSAGPRKGQLGLRFEPLGIGVLVREVAPGGAADGVVRAGDVLLSADGHALDALDTAAVAELLVGAPGEGRTVEVYRDGATRKVRLVPR